MRQVPSQFSRQITARRYGIRYTGFRGDLPSRVVKFQPLQAYFPRFQLTALGDDRMTGVTFIGDGPACFVGMETIVATKTTPPNIMPDIVGPHFPIRFHFREEIVSKYPPAGPGVLYPFDLSKNVIRQRFCSLSSIHSILAFIIRWCACRSSSF